MPVSAGMKRKSEERLDAAIRREEEKKERLDAAIRREKEEEFIRTFLQAEEEALERRRQERNRKHHFGLRSLMKQSQE